MDRLSQQLVPQFICERYEAGQMDGRVEGWCLSVDLSSFTPLVETLMIHGKAAAEILANMMKSFFTPLVQAVYHEGGFISRFSGDAFTALFLEGKNKGDACLRAALAIRDAMPSFQDIPTVYGSFSLTVRIGCGSGLIEWGIILPNDAADRDVTAGTFYFRGTAISRALLAQERAPKNAIVVNSDSPPVWLKGYVETRFEESDLLNLSPESSYPYSGEKLRKDDKVRVCESHHLFISSEILNCERFGEFRHVLTAFLGLPTDVDYEGLHEFCQLIGAIQKKFGGTFHGIDFGDKGCTILLFWGAPRAFENDLFRAAAFLCELKHRSSLSFRAGVTWRLMFAGFVGAEERQDYTCYGRGIVLAARLMTAANEGALWLDEDLARRLREKYLLSSVGSIKLKGVESPVSVFSLNGELGETIHSRGNQNFVGRLRELREITDFMVSPTGAIENRVLFLTGEAGIGKSRLLEAVKESILSVGDHDCRVFFCQADGLKATSLHPFISFFTQHFQLDPAATRDTNRELFHRRIDEIICATQFKEAAQEVDRTSSLLAALVGITWSDSLYEQLDPKLRFENTLDAIAWFFIAENSRQPTILIVDDIQWLDNDSQRVLNVFIEQTGRGNPSLVLAGRSIPQSLQTFMSDDNHIRSLSLQPLPPDEWYPLVETLLPNRKLSRTLLDLLSARTGGNPFYLDQIVRFLSESDALHDTDEGLSISETSAELPDDLRALLIARLDRLSRDVRHVVQTASILGHEFELTVLLKMLDDAPLVYQHVLQAEQDRILDALSEIRYIFHHALLRDAAYDMQILERRKLLHETAALAIETMHAQDLAPHYHDLAWHFDKAAVNEKAIHYHRCATTQAQENYRHHEALQHLSRMLSLLAETPQSAEIRCINLLDQAESLRYIGQWQDAEHVLLSALQLSEQNTLMEYAVKARQVLGRLWLSQGKLTEALELQNRAFADLPLCSADPSKKASLYNDIGLTLTYLTRFDEAFESFSEAKSINEKSGNTLELSKVLGNMGILAWRSQKFDEALHYFQQDLLYSEQVGHKLKISKVLGNLGTLYYYMSDNERAIDHYQRQEQIDSEFGDKNGLIIVRGNISLYFKETGNVDMARDYAIRNLGLAKLMKNSTALIIALTVLGWADEQDGKLEEALVKLNEAVAIGHQFTMRYELPEVYINLARVHRSLMQLEQAREAVRVGLSLTQELKTPAVEKRLMVEQASLEAKMGNLKPLYDLRELLNHISEPEHEALIHFTLWECSKSLKIPDIDADAHREKALEIYESLPKKNSSWEIRTKLTSLESVNQEKIS